MERIQLGFQEAIYSNTFSLAANENAKNVIFILRPQEISETKN